MTDEPLLGTELSGKQGRQTAIDNGATAWVLLCNGGIPNAGREGCTPLELSLYTLLLLPDREVGTDHIELALVYTLRHEVETTEAALPVTTRRATRRGTGNAPSTMIQTAFRQDDPPNGRQPSSTGRQYAAPFRITQCRHPRQLDAPLECVSDAPEV